MLTEVQVGRGSRAGWSSALSKRRVGAELGGGAGTGVLRALDLPEGVRAGPARVVQSQMSPVVTGGDELRRNRGSPAWRSTAELDGGGARVDRVPGVRPGVFKGGRAGIAAGRRGIRIPATSPVISGPLRSREGRGEEGADARGRLVSGGAAAMRACWALAAPTGGAGGSGGSRAERARLWSGRAGLVAQEGVGR